MAGRVDEAIDALERCREIFAGVPAIFFSWQPDLIDAYLRAGRVGDARDVLRIFEPDAARSRQERAIVARARAVLTNRGPVDAAFQEALRLCDGGEWPFERARCLLAYGERLRRNGQRVAARTELRAALDAFERIGAADFAGRARAELRATGQTVRARGAGQTRELTAQELQIALLVARGATNREAAASVFLSPRTVEKTPLQRIPQARRPLPQRARTATRRPVGKLPTRDRARRFSTRDLPVAMPIPRRTT